MKLTKIINKLAPLATAVAMACSPVQVKKPVTYDVPVSNVTLAKPTVKNQEPTVTYVANTESKVQPYNPSIPTLGSGIKYQAGTGYGRTHGLGEVDTGSNVDRNANVPIVRKRRKIIPRLILKSRKKPTIADHYKTQSDEFTRNACRSYVDTVQNMRKNSGRFLHYGTKSELENKCVKSSKRMCRFNNIKENRTDDLYRSCVRINMYDGFIKPGF